ncbi:hypothetical protein LC567_05550 [Fusobacterium animalis]|uniref:hypothetical protein n=1 Tax=Fusobacterium animalis TaxID=76859 RepID=UPI0030D51569
MTNIFIFSWVVFFGSFLCHTTQETTKEKNSSPKYSIKKNGKALNTNTFSSFEIYLSSYLLKILS